MAKRLVRQFKTQAAPAEASGYRPQLAVQHPVDYGVPAMLPPTVQRPEMVQQPPVFDLSQIPNIPMLVLPEAQLPPRAMGTPAPRHPTNTAYTPNRIWSPDPFNPSQPPDPRLQRVTGEGDLPMFIQPTATATNLQPPRRPVAPPAYGQPNVGVDITPEQYTLPPQQSIVQEMPPVVDYGPITTPIAAPVQEEMGYIEPTEPYPTTGPQVTATEQAFYDPQPVESAYADPIDVPYIQPQPQPQPLDIPQDDITNLIDTIIPETLEAKTIDFPQEDPYTNQELIDQANFTQADPSIYSPETAPITVDEMTELAYPFPTDYAEPIAQEAAQPTYIPPPQPVQQPLITQAPELPMPDIPAPAGGARAEDEFFLEDYHRELPHQRINIDEAIPGGSTVADPNAPIIAKILEESTLAPVSGPAVTTDVTGDVDTGYPGADKPLPTYDRGVPPVPEEVVVEESADQTTPYGPDEGGLPQKPEAGVTQPPVGGRKWLHTGPQDFAETRWQLFGAGQGPPVITDTPSVVGPQVNRETGEITTQPLTWWANQPVGSSVSPYGAGTTTTPPEGTGTTMGGGALGTGFTAEQVMEMAGGSITPVLDQLHPGATSDGQTVTFGDVGDYDAWVDGTLSLRPDLKGIDDLGYQKRDAEGNRVGWGNHALDGFNQLTGTINSVFNFMGDPSREFTAAVLEDFGMKMPEGGLKKLASNLNKFRKESSQMWETSQDKAWGRKWNDFTKTQEYGDMQPLGIFALLTNPPAALAMTANSILYDIKNAAAGMFNDNPNYKGNMAQDILNGAFHFLGKAAKSVGSLFGKLGKKIGEKFNFTSKDMKNDPMEVSRQLLFRSKNEDPRVGDIRYNLVKVLLEGGVDVRFHNNAVTFDKGIAKARIADIEKTITDMGLDASMIEIMAGTEGLDDFPELKAFLEALAKQKRAMAQS